MGAIHDAASRGDVAKVEALVRGASSGRLLTSIARPTGAREGRRCIMRLQKGRSEMVGFLLDHGAEINAQDKEGFTPLFIALETGQSGSVEFLRQHGGRR